MPNAYAFGAAIMWLPFFAIAHIFSLVFQNINYELFRADGYSFLYVFFINFSGWVYGLLSALIIYRTLRLIFRDRQEKSRALTAVFAIWLATPWIYYQFFEPFMSHMASLFLVSSFAYISVKTWKSESNSIQKTNIRKFEIRDIADFIKDNWALAAVTFLMVSTRWQNSIFLLALIPFIWPVRQKYGSNVLRSLVRKIAPLLLPAIAWLLIQSLAWHHLYGKYFLVPQGYRFVQFKFNGLYTLFSSDRGLLLWSPVIIFAIFGLFFLFKKSKTIAFVVVLAFLGQWAINSSLNDVGGGDAFGARRFIELFAFLSIPLTALFVNLRKQFWLICFIPILLILWNIVLLGNYRKETLPKSGEFDIFKIRYFDIIKHRALRI